MASRPKLETVHHKHGRTRDPRRGRRSHCDSRRYSRSSKHTANGRSGCKKIRKAGCACLQLWCHMVGFCRENTDQAVSAHAARKSRRYSTTSQHTTSTHLIKIALILTRSLRNRPILLALLPAKPVEGKNHRCQPSDLLALLPGQNCLCHGQDWDVRSDQGPCHGLA